MAQVIYLGNGSDGGQVPVDSTPTPRATRSMLRAMIRPRPPSSKKISHGNPENIVTGDLSRTDAVFLYWSTAPNGGGQVHGWPQDTSFAFPNQTGDLTLYAQWGITTGLTGGGVTTHYAFYYDETLQQTATNPSGVEPARTNSMVHDCEAVDFKWMQAQFPGVDITKATTLPIPVYVTVLTGGANTTAQIRLKPGPTGPASAMRPLIVAEVVEIFDACPEQGLGFRGRRRQRGELRGGLVAVPDRAVPTGQRLGHGLVQHRHAASLAQHLASGKQPPRRNSTHRPVRRTGTGTHYGSRKDYVNQRQAVGRATAPATGCSLLFIYYLYHQLGFTDPADHRQRAGPGFQRQSDRRRVPARRLPEPDRTTLPIRSRIFASLLAAAYPPDQVSSIPGPNTDDPWPIGSPELLSAPRTPGAPTRSTTSSPRGGPTPTASTWRWTASAETSGGTTSIPPDHRLRRRYGRALRHAANRYLPEPQSQGPAADPVRLRRQLCAAARDLPGNGETPAAVNSSINVLGTAFPATTEFFFLAGADPYFTNVVNDPTGPTNVSVPWLSEDLQGLHCHARGVARLANPGAGGPQFVENSSGTGVFDSQGAYNYIQKLLVHLNQTYGDPNGGVDPFAVGSNIIPQQQTEFTADSSVTPFSTIGGNTYNNYSFAIARVRLKGTQAAGAATGVRVFFRLWGTQTADTGWDPTYTYLSHNDGSGNPLWPQAPSDDHTIPFFATSAQPNFTTTNDPEFQTGGFTDTGANNLTITIEQGDSQWSYFGCFLNVNDGSVLVNGVAVPNAFPGTHHCLVAQIAYPGAPIETPPGTVPTTPESGGQLAQRNLQVTTTDNPGPSSTHRVPQTFDVKPSGPPPTSGPLAGRPDELMVDWGEIPPGSTARIYWPAVSSAEVIKLASWMYGVHPLTAADANTIEVKTIKGVTFVPIPQGTGQWFAGLFTLDLPQTVVTGEEFDIVVRRIGKRPLRTPPPPPPPPPHRPRRRSRRAPRRRSPCPGDGAPAAPSTLTCPNPARRPERRPRPRSRRSATTGSPTSATSSAPSR